MKRFLLKLLLALAPVLSVTASEPSLLQSAKAVYAALEGNPTTTRLSYERALALDPDSFFLSRRTSQWQLADEDLTAAAATRRSFATHHPLHLPAQLDYASFLLRQAPDDEVARDAAQETLELANENFPSEPNVFSKLINLYENRAQRPKSLALFREKLAAKEGPASYWLALAPIAKTLLPIDSTEYQDALERIFSQIPESSLANPSLARRVSEHYRRKNDLPTAIARLEAHLALAPSSHSLRTRLGLLQLSHGEQAAGKATLQQVILIDPDQALAHRSLAKLFQREDEPEAALHHRAEDLRITGGSPEETIAVAKAYLDLAQPHPARLLLEKARFHHPDDLSILAQLAIATLRDGLTVQSARLFRQAEQMAETSKDPQASRFLDVDFQVEFANSLVAAGDPDSAETRFRQAAQAINLDEDPVKYASVVTALAKLWIDQGKNLAPAQALLQRALALDPENETAAGLLAK